MNLIDRKRMKGALIGAAMVMLLGCQQRCGHRKRLSVYMACGGIFTRSSRT